MKKPIQHWKFSSAGWAFFRQNRQAVTMNLVRDSSQIGGNVHDNH